MKAITQEAPMGCAIACCASLAGLSYKEMRKHFDRGDVKDMTTGFYNRDIVQALRRAGITAKGSSIKTFGNKSFKNGTIVFAARSKKYPEGHFLLKTPKGWMNPWINHPTITPAKAGFQKKPPEGIDWVIETTLEARI